MDYEAFDNDNEVTTDEQYFAFVAWLSSWTANDFRTAKGNPEREKEALCRYYKRGLIANLTMSELIDFLAVNAESILEVAGYTGDESLTLIYEISDTLTEAEIMAATLPT